MLNFFYCFFVDSWLIFFSRANHISIIAENDEIPSAQNPPLQTKTPIWLILEMKMAIWFARIKKINQLSTKNQQKSNKNILAKKFYFKHCKKVKNNNLITDNLNIY